MAKPFSLQELEARVRALVRRGMGEGSSLIKHGPLVYDQAGLVATIDGKMVDRLCEWGEEVSNNAIKMYVHRLRKKIEKGPIRIATVRFLGYYMGKIAP